jgi:hypothetical protein
VVTQCNRQEYVAKTYWSDKRSTEQFSIGVSGGAWPGVGRTPNQAVGEEGWGYNPCPVLKINISRPRHVRERLRSAVAVAIENHTVGAVAHGLW